MEVKAKSTKTAVKLLREPAAGTAPDGERGRPTATDPSGHDTGNLGVRWGVQFGMLFGRMARVIAGMEAVSICHLSVVGGLLGIARRMVPGGFGVVMRGLRMMVCGLFVMMRCFF